MTLEVLFFASCWVQKPYKIKARYLERLRTSALGSWWDVVCIVRCHPYIESLLTLIYPSCESSTYCTPARLHGTMVSWSPDVCSRNASATTVRINRALHYDCYVIEGITVEDSSWVLVPDCRMKFRPTVNGGSMLSMCTDTTYLCAVRNLVL